MTIKFKNNTDHVMMNARYKKHWGGYIKLDGFSGRYHAKILKGNTVQLHYDIFVDGGKKHFCVPMPLKISEEVSRLKIIDNQTYAPKEKSEKQKAHEERQRKEQEAKKERQLQKELARRHLYYPDEKETSKS